MNLSEQEKIELNTMRENLAKKLGVTPEQTQQEEKVIEGQLRAIPRESLQLGIDFLNQAASQYCEDYDQFSQEERVQIGEWLIKAISSIVEDAPTGDSEDKAFYLVAAIEAARLKRGGWGCYSIMRLYQDVLALYEEEV